MDGGAAGKAGQHAAGGQVSETSRILVVEEDVIARHALGRLLTTERFEPIFACGEQDALSSLRVPARCLRAALFAVPARGPMCSGRLFEAMHAQRIGFVIVSDLPEELSDPLAARHGAVGVVSRTDENAIGLLLQAVDLAVSQSRTDHLRPRTTTATHRGPVMSREAIQRARFARGWSQEKLAEKAKLSKRTIGAAESHDFAVRISLDSAVRIARALGRPLEELVQTW